MNSCLGGNLGLLLKTAPRENFQEQPFQVRWDDDQSLIQHKEKSNVDTTNALGELVFDNLYRLTSESISGGLNNGTIDYTYDKVSNRTSRNSSVAGVSNQSHSYTLNDLLSHHTYDDNGSTIASPDFVNKTGKTADVYDFRNKLIRRTSDSGDVINLSYNADGHRVKKEVLAGGVLGTNRTINFLVDNNNPTGYSQVVEEVNGINVLEKVYHYGHSRIALDDYATSERRRHFYSLDGHGSVRALTDADGEVKEEYDFDSYGILIGFRKHDGTSMVEKSVDDFASLSVNTFLFAGEEWDADMGMYYNRFRYYDVHNGRFNSMDSWEGSRGNNVTLNKYLYGNGNAVSNVDPSGHFSLTEVISVQNIQITNHSKNARSVYRAAGNVYGLLVKASILLNLAVAAENPKTRLASIKAWKYNKNKLKEFRRKKNIGALAIKKIPRIARFVANVTARQELANTKPEPVDIKRNGLPDFGKNKHLAPNPKSVVFIPLTGSRAKDRTQLFLKTGTRGITRQSTWHHHEALGIMMLVKWKIHRSHGHAGGVFFYEILTGKKYK